MSKYPNWWDTTLTVFNKFQDPQTNVVVWHKHIVNNCFWKYAGNKVVIAETILESNSITCRIPQNDKYLSRYEWENLPNDKMSNYFTLGIGDIIIKGAVEENINEYKNGERSSDIIKKYKALQGCMIIENASDNSGTTRNNKHYYVTGI